MLTLTERIDARQSDLDELVLRRAGKTADKYAPTVLGTSYSCGIGDDRWMLREQYGHWLEWPHVDAPVWVHERPHKNADVYFTDPPFNIGQKYMGFVDKRSGGDHFDLMLAMMLAQSAAAGRRSLIAWHVPEAMVYSMLECARLCGLRLWQHVVRSYGFGQYGETRYITGHESLLLFCKRDGCPRFFPRRVLVESVRRTMRPPDKRLKGTKWKGYVPPSTVWAFPRPQGNNRERWAKHPNQLPLRYLARIVLGHSRKGGTIVECCSGSGGLGLVSVVAGRRYVGLDCSAECITSAAERIQDREQRELARAALEDVGAPSRLALPPGRDWGAV